MSCLFQIKCDVIHLMFPEVKTKEIFKTEVHSQTLILDQHTKVCIRSFITMQKSESNVDSWEELLFFLSV